MADSGKRRCSVAHVVVCYSDKNMEVTVQTGNGFLDGTNAFLYLELIGEGDKRSGESNVAKGGYHDDFESGK